MNCFQGSLTYASHGACFCTHCRHILTGTGFSRDNAICLLVLSCYGLCAGAIQYQWGYAHGMTWVMLQVQAMLEAVNRALLSQPLHLHLRRMCLPAGLLHPRASSPPSQLTVGHWLLPGIPLCPCVQHISCWWCMLMSNKPECSPPVLSLCPVICNIFCYFFNSGQQCTTPRYCWHHAAPRALGYSAACSLAVVSESLACQILQLKSPAHQLLKQKLFLACRRRCQKAK